MLILGEHNEEIRLDSASENREAAVSLAGQSRFSLDLFTPDMDPRIFDNSKIETSVLRLARTHPGSNIRILTRDSTRAVQQGHCLIRLAQRLTSSVLIHNPANEHKDEISTFMIADGVGVLHRPHSSSNNYDAIVNYMSPQRAGELHDFFNEMWERSTPDSQIRRLYI